MSDNVPITEELRDAMKRYDNFDGTSRVVLGESNFDRLCDAIDATHANLERENSKLRELVWALDWCTENFDTPSKCDRCPLSQSKALEPECEVRMRELGVEVD